MRTKIVRINAVPFQVPADELTDPHGDEPGGGCDAMEPEPYAAVCTLGPHDSEVMHIAHDGGRNVIAMWGEPAEVTADDLEG